MKAKICHEPSCNTLIDKGSTYCDKHQKPKSVPFQNAVRSNESLYNTAQWRKLRKQKMAEQPFCSKCGSTKEISILHVHHRIPPRGDESVFFDFHNLEVLCEKCHRLHTNEEIYSRKYLQN